MPITDDAVQMRGMAAVAGDGDKLGTIEDIYLDRETGKPEWMTLKTGLFGGHLSFVPLAEAGREGDTITVPYDKATVKDAPRVGADGELSEPEEADLYRYYGLEYSEARSEEEHEVVLHAEEPVVDKRAVAKERVRLDKDVVRDEHTVTDDVRKERIDVDADRA